MKTANTVLRLSLPILLVIGGQVSSAEKPNVLFIAIDDLNDWAGPFGGNPQVKTPHLDRFAKQSVVFSKAYCPATVCCPSRSALLTGKHATHTGVLADGAEELYDHADDPLEYENLAYKPEFNNILERLKRYLPDHHEPPSP